MITAWCSAVARAASPELREYFLATVEARAAEYAVEYSHVIARRAWEADPRRDDDRYPDGFDERQAALPRHWAAQERLRIASGVYESRRAAPGTKFYVTVRRDDGAAVALAGPYVTHREALEVLPEAKRLAHERDLGACWYAYGTAAMATGETVAVFGVVTPENNEVSP